MIFFIIYLNIFDDFLLFYGILVMLYIEYIELELNLKIF